MSEFITVATVDSIEEGHGAAFPVNGRMVAVFHTPHGFHAIDDICPHMGASLAEGHLEGDVVTCPWHAWQFKVSDGTWCDNPSVKTRAFDLRVQGNEIQVRVPD